MGSFSLNIYEVERRVFADCYLKNYLKIVIIGLKYIIKR
jgi:hypothetical protein